ncbi:helix-turn-helix transcriptional regulator [Tenuifilaceae bacterium CYCD]|nr:helix-turn-helix transcriptional regulator [Tenuifilaceae bacterium CYCD]
MVSGVVIVVHSNDIIRKGLSSIVRSIAGIRVVEQASFGELDFRASDILGYIFEPSALSHFKKLGGVCAKSKPKGILIYADSKRIDSDLPFIETNFSTDKIIDIVKETFSNSKTFLENQDNELSSREVDVLKCVALGMSNKEIADKLFISIHTVITHRKNITAKLDIKSASGLTIYAIMEGYIEPSSIDIRG